MPSTDTRERLEQALRDSHMPEECGETPLDDYGKEIVRNVLQLMGRSPAERGTPYWPTDPAYPCPTCGQSATAPAERGAETMDGLSVICGQCGTLVAGEEAGDRVKWVRCRGCKPVPAERGEGATRCEKCGGEDIHTRYRRKGEYLDGVWQAKVECLRRYCRTCGYGWTDPLASPAPSAPEEP